VYYKDLLAYAVPELETLESAYAWLSRLGSEVISSDKLIDQLDPSMLAVFRGVLQSQNSSHESAATGSQQRVRAKRAISRTRLKGAKTQVKRRRRAK
jgi:hypothetical protein